MTPTLLALSAVATLVLPFLIGMWIGHPASGGMLRERVRQR